MISKHTDKQIEGSRIESFERAVKLKRRAALLAIHTEMPSKYSYYYLNGVLSIVTEVTCCKVVVILTTHVMMPAGPRLN
jgi:hypothetical protein